MVHGQRVYLISISNLRKEKPLNCSPIKEMIVRKLWISGTISSIRSRDFAKHVVFLQNTNLNIQDVVGGLSQVQSETMPNRAIHVIKLLYPTRSLGSFREQ